ncbi:MAG: DUF4139 domain-containing protein [Methanothrix sp.]
MILLMLSLCLPAAVASSDDSRSIEATTALKLPVDSVTIYPGGLMAVKSGGSLDVTEGVHEFVINLPAKADKSSALLSVSNATLERVVYEATPIYTLNITSAGSQMFDLSYLMPSAASWQPRYDLHLKNDSILVKASAVVKNQGGEDLKDVRLKLVAGPAPSEPSPKEALQFERSLALASAAPAEEFAEYALESETVSTGELETLYIFELDGRKELVTEKEIGFPLFEIESPLIRIFTWDAYNEAEGPAREEIRANNTLQSPWPSGEALIYKDGDYVSTIEMPYTPSGTNATIYLGPSADLKVESRLADYNLTENIKKIESGDGNHTIKETIERWTYNLSIISNLGRTASLEVTDTKPLDAKIISVSPQPVEITAASLKWEIELSPRQKTAINYAYEVTTTEGLDSQYYY